MAFELYKAYLEDKGEKTEEQEQKNIREAIDGFIEKSLNCWSGWENLSAGEMNLNNKKFSDFLNRFIIWYDSKFPSDPMDFKKKF